MFFVAVWFCCLSWLAFLILAHIINLMHIIFLHWVICFGGYLFVHTLFFKKYSNFWPFLSVPHLVDNYAKIVDERGRNFMCNRKLPSLLVDSMFLVDFSFYRIFVDILLIFIKDSCHLLWTKLHVFLYRSVFIWWHFEFVDRCFFLKKDFEFERNSRFCCLVLLRVLSHSLINDRYHRFSNAALFISFNGFCVKHFLLIYQILSACVYLKVFFLLFSW